MIARLVVETEGSVRVVHVSGTSVNVACIRGRWRIQVVLGCMEAIVIKD
jgi:hypothetical protein